MRTRLPDGLCITEIDEVFLGEDSCDVVLWLRTDCGGTIAMQIGYDEFMARGFMIEASVRRPQRARLH